MAQVTIPLWLVFALQSLVVVVSFVAVILVLVLQQQELYKTAVFDRIDLHQQRSEYAIMSPIVAREGRFRQLQRQVLTTPDMWYEETMNQSSDAVRRFNNFSYYLCKDDPIVYALFQHARHSTRTHANGDRMYGITVLGYNGPYLSSLSPPWTENEVSTTHVHLNYPLTYDSPLQYYFPISHQPWSLALRKQLTPGWGRGGVTWSQTAQIFTVASGLSYPLKVDPVTQEATLSFVYSFNVSYMSDSMASAQLSPDTKLLLFDGVSDVIMATRNTGQPDFNAPATDLWTLDTFPDQGLIIRFRAVLDSKCKPVDNCTKVVVEEGEDIVSLLYMTTDYGYKLHLFQITPRKYYFEAGERAVVVGAAIGAVAALIVLGSCVVIWFAMRRPIHQLRESMELAAVMRNDEVSDTSSVLTELNLLSISFMQMNDKLLQARPFMPQSLLFVEDDDDDDDDDNANFGGVVNIVKGTGEEGDYYLGSGDDDEGSVALNTSKGSMSILAPQTPPNLSPSQSLAISPSNASLQGGNTSLHQLDMSGHNNTQSSSININVNNPRNSLPPPLRAANGGGSSPNPNRFHMAIKQIIHKSQMLVSKKVAVMVINARGTHALASGGGAVMLEKEQMRLVELVERCTRAEKGVVDSFQGDHFVLTFNAVRTVGTPGRNGALVALAISTGALNDELALGKFSMGLSVGRALVGNVGSVTMKKNCTIGAVYTNATGLERLSKRTEHACLVHGHAMVDIEAVAYCLRLGNISLSNREQDSLWAIKQLVTGASDEWLYEIEAAAKRNPYQLQNEAVALACGEEADGRRGEEQSSTLAVGQQGAGEVDVGAPQPTTTTAMDTRSGGEMGEDFAASLPLSIEGSPIRVLAMTPTSSAATTPHNPPQHATNTVVPIHHVQQHQYQHNVDYDDTPPAGRPLVSLYDFTI